LQNVSHGAPEENTHRVADGYKWHDIMNSMLKCLLVTAAFVLVCGNASAADVKAFVGATLIDGR
jgi:hypothetical protein